jgi:predicted nucleic acid-binding Zn finger protein
MGNGTMAVRPLTVEVRSESKPGESYTVTLAHCDCPDFFWRKGSAENPFCKHIIAAYEQAGWHAPEPEADVRPFQAAYRQHQLVEVSTENGPVRARIVRAMGRVVEVRYLVTGVTMVVSVERVRPA